MSAKQKDALRQLAANGTISNPEVACEISVGLDGFSELWTDEILPFIAGGGSELRFVEGANGRGKTHMLRVLSKLSEERGFLTCYTSCGADSEPFESLETTYRVIAQNLRWSNGGNPVVGLHRILETVDREQLATIRSSRHVVAPVRNLCRAYQCLLNDDTVSPATIMDLRELMIGNKTHRVVFRELFRRTPNLPRPISGLGKRNAGQWLRSLLSIPRELGFKGLIVLFDETGSDLHWAKAPQRKRQTHMANLRNLIDHMAVGDLPGCGIVYGVTHNLLELAQEDYPALAQRIERTDLPDIWEALSPNPRAVWTNLDELTSPTPPSTEFFELLGNRLATLAREADACQRSPREVNEIVREEVRRAITSAQDDSIRGFVKRVTSKLMN
jgi:hypothetical protein